ncbi:MFS transporter [Streptomyces sp. NPDC012888]|uniref:MFS transporter n=1 Tax=Streptomyces sp. NPDC012888 TaxID=3364855 RepID=UPI0036AAF6D9
MKDTHQSRFASLSVRNFRLFTLGQIVSATGTWMMVVAQDWLVLSLTGDSATALGTVTALQFAPLLLFTLHGGLLADRYDKRRLLVAANLAGGALALLLAVLVLSGQVRLWHVDVLALALGCVNAVEIPARMSFVAEMVGPELLPNASALSGAYFNLARIAGPAVAGLLIAWLGTGPVMLLNAATFLGTVVALRMMRPDELVAPAGPGARPGRAGVRDGLRYTTGRRDLLPVFGLVAVVSLFGLNFQLTLPLLAKTVFHTEAAAFGLFTTAMAAGSLAAAMVTAGRRTRPTARLVAAAAVGLGAVEVAAGWAPTPLVAMALLCVTGFTTLYFAQAANHHIQLGADPHYRGRVLALYTLILQGSTPVGALLTGWLTAHFGARSGLWAGGLVALAAGLLVLSAAGRIPPAPPGGVPGVPAAARPAVQRGSTEP